jgi:hypothetical protein
MTIGGGDNEAVKPVTPKRGVASGEEPCVDDGERDQWEAGERLRGEQTHYHWCDSVRCTLTHRKSCIAGEEPSLVWTTERGISGRLVRVSKLRYH